MESLSDSLIAVIIPEGAHHLDLRAAHKDDPASVILARQIEKENIRKWINEYHTERKSNNGIWRFEKTSSRNNEMHESSSSPEASESEEWW